MNLQHEQHIFKRFDQEMRHLHALVIKMGKLSVAQLQAAVATLQQRDSVAAQTVIQDDKKINDLDVQADDEIVRIIALRQPMAGDLRKIIAVSKIVTELERAGDEARKIALLTIRFYGKDAPQDPPLEPALAGVYALAEFVQGLLAQVIEAFDTMNLESAIQVLKAEQELDEQVQAAVRRLSEVTLPDSGGNAHFVDSVLSVRALARFGAHAKNIAGHIVFIEHGIDVRHVGVERILAQIRGSG